MKQKAAYVERLIMMNLGVVLSREHDVIVAVLCLGKRNSNVQKATFLHVMESLW